MSLITVLYTKDSGPKMDIDKDKGLNYGKMAANILVTGNRIRPMVKDA